MKEVEQNKNCTDTAGKFTNENNIIAIRPGLLPAIQSPDMRETKKGGQFLFSVAIILNRPTAAWQKQHKEIPLGKIKSKGEKKTHNSNLSPILTLVHYSQLQFLTRFILPLISISLPSFYKTQRMTIRFSISLHKYRLLDLPLSAFIMLHEHSCSCELCSLLCCLKLTSFVIALLHERKEFMFFLLFLLCTRLNAWKWISHYVEQFGSQKKTQTNMSQICSANILSIWKFKTV